MSFATNARNFGRILGAVIVAAAEVKAEEINQRNSMLRENAKDQEWADRRQQALDNIDAGLKNDRSMKLFSGMTNKQEQAIRLRAEVNQKCREQDDFGMRMTERKITNFQTSAY